MYQSIGEVYLRSIIKQKTLPPSQTVNERSNINIPYNLTSNTDTKLREIEIRGYTFNDGVKTRKEYITDISALMKRSAAYNRIQLEDIDGYLEIIGTEIRNTEEQRNMFILFAKVLPINDYFSYYIYKQMKHDYSYLQFFPSYLTMPYGVDKIHIRNSGRESLRVYSVNTLETPEGNLPIFKYRDWKDYRNATYTGTLTSFDDTESYKAVVLSEDQQYIRWNHSPSLDDLSGNLTFTIFCKIDNASTQDINVEIKDIENVVLLTQNFELTTTTTSITLDTVRLTPYKACNITLKKNDSTPGDIIVGGIRTIHPDAVRRIEFTTPAPIMNKGECKVFDTVTPGNDNRSTWKRVYYPNMHKFTGEIVFENATMQWGVNPNVSWLSTGWLTDRISDEVGSFYPSDYATQIVELSIDDIKPDRIVIDIRLRDTDRAEHAIVEITPVAIYVTTIPLMPSLSKGWTVTMTNTVSKGVLNDTIKSLTMLTSTSSISIIRSTLLSTVTTTPYNMFNFTPFNYNSIDDGFYTYENEVMTNGYTFALTVLPRVTDNTDKQFVRTPIDGEAYYVDGEFIDKEKEITLNDFVTSLFESGLLIKRSLAHKTLF